MKTSSLLKIIRRPISYGDVQELNETYLI